MFKKNHQVQVDDVEQQAKVQAKRDQFIYQFKIILTPLI